MNIVFIVGTGRCGSTLIHDMLCMHNDVGFLSYMDDNYPRLSMSGRFNNAVFAAPFGRTKIGGKLRFAPSEAYRLLSRNISPMYSNSSRDLEARDVTPWLERRCRDFFQSRYDIQGKPVFSHKYTGWSRMEFFSRIFPEARFIHIVRDGRAVANSWLQMPWWGGYRGPQNWLWGDLSEPYLQEWLRSDRSYVVLAGIAWKILIESFERGATGFDETRYLPIRYEDFLARPRELMESMLSFSRVKWTSKFEQRFRDVRIYKSRMRAFEKDLTEDQLASLEASLGEKLACYGYQ